MSRPEPVVFDTSALYGLLSAEDVFHTRAVNAYTRLLSLGHEFWLTSYGLVEFISVVHRRLGFGPARTFYAAVPSVFRTLWIGPELHAEAWSELEARSGAGLNFVDWTNLLAARQLGASLFTFDSGFSREGAMVIPA